MAEYHYVKAAADIAQLQQECLDAGLPVTYINGAGDPTTDVWIYTSVTLTAPQVTTLDGLVAAHVARPSSGSNTAGQSGANYLVNSNFEIDQRGRAGSTQGDDVYVMDRWYLLVQTNPSTITRAASNSTLTGSAANVAQPLQQNAAAQRLGMAQIVEGVQSQGLRGQYTTLQAQVSTPDGALRFALLSWTGTRDAVTSDVVNDWTSTNYTAGNFFVANIKVIAIGRVPQVVGPGLALVSVTGVSYDCNNLIAFFWTENAQAQNTGFNVFQPAIYPSSVALPYAPPEMVNELARCQRYCLRINAQPLGQAQSASNLYNKGALLFPTTMRATPALLSGATYTVNSGSAGTCNLDSPSPGGTGFNNPANNWTTSAIISVTCTLDAEL